jgi:peptide chain release factor 1
MSIEVDGKDLTGLDNEPGGHRIQRIPPTERKGRVHTSTVTVAVINPTVKRNTLADRREESDFKVEWFSGTGSGGQHRNKHQNSCRLTHIPTGLEQISQTRSRTSSQATAMSNLIVALDGLATTQHNNVVSKDRKEQVGSGMRGDKIRTYRFQDNNVTDHLTGKSAPCDKVMKGKFDLLWK